MFKKEREESQFQWSILGDIETGRPNLGPMVHVAAYRLIHFTSVPPALEGWLQRLTDGAKGP